MQHDFLKNYKHKTKESRRLYSRAVKVFPGGVSHNIRYFEPYPFFVSGAKGKQLSDVDGNKYTDYWMGHWALILGHSPKVVVNALTEQAKNGMLYGTVNGVSVELAETIKKLMPRAEMMRFSEHWLRSDHVRNQACSRTNWETNRCKGDRRLARLQYRTFADSQLSI